MKIPIFLAILALGAATSFAQDKPTLEQVKKTFEADDALLTKAFTETCASLDKAKAAELQKKEKAWLGFRETMSEAAGQSGAGKENDSPKLSVNYWETMTTYTENRIKFLRTYSGKYVPKGITGEYKDGMNGDLSLEETKDGILFSLSVVRGKEEHTGQITGIVQQKGDKAHFKEEVDPAEKKKPCELVFSFNDGHIVKVVETSPDPDAESGVHYDGDYYKTGDPVTP